MGHVAGARAGGATGTKRHDDDSTFDYKFDTEIDTMGFSGSPVLDTKGCVVGIYHGHGELDGQKFWDGVDITTAIKQATPKQ